MLTPTDLQATRELLGLTRGELARHLSCSEVAVYKWERAERAIPENLEAEIADLTERFDALVDRLATGTGPITLPLIPANREHEGWPARSWRHAAALARAEQGRSIVVEDGPTYVEAKAAAHWRKIQGAPDAWRELAEWAEQHIGDETGAVLITQTGRIVGEAERVRDGAGHTYRVTPDTKRQWRLDKTIADMAAAMIAREVGEPVVLVKAWEVTRGAS